MITLKLLDPARRKKPRLIFISYIKLYRMFPYLISSVNLHTKLKIKSILVASGLWLRIMAGTETRDKVYVLHQDLSIVFSNTETFKPLDWLHSLKIGDSF